MRKYLHDTIIILTVSFTFQSHPQASCLKLSKRCCYHVPVSIGVDVHLVYMFTPTATVGVNMYTAFMVAGEQCCWFGMFNIEPTITL